MPVPPPVTTAILPAKSFMMALPWLSFALAVIANARLAYAARASRHRRNSRHCLALFRRLDAPAEQFVDLYFQSVAVGREALRGGEDLRQSGAGLGSRQAAHRRCSTTPAGIKPGPNNPVGSGSGLLPGPARRFHVLVLRRPLVQAAPGGRDLCFGRAMAARP